MASIHRRKGTKKWHAAFYDAEGRRCMRSTGSSKRGEAMSIALDWEEAARRGREGRLTVDQARKVIADIYARANRDKLPAGTVREYVKHWMQMKEAGLADSSFTEYKRLTADLIDFLGKRADGPLDAITSKDIVKYRARLLARVSPATVNKSLKALRGIWTQARKDELITRNVFDSVSYVKAEQKKTRRKNFTGEQVKALLPYCKDSWRGLVLAGLYTGQRLSDLLALTWEEIDLAGAKIQFTTQKTGAELEMPIHPALMKWLMDNAGDDPAALVFPDFAGISQNTVSRQFMKKLHNAGLIKAEPSHKSANKGRDSKRTLNELSFHSLRHAYVTMMKEAGATDGITKSIVGHQSDAVNRLYTHIGIDAMREAVNRLPDVTKAD